MNKKILALGAFMMFSGAKAKEIPANFDNPKAPEEKEVSYEYNADQKKAEELVIRNFAGFQQKKVDSLVKQNVEGGGEPEFRPASLEDLENILNIIENINSSFSKLNLADYKLEEGGDRDAVETVDNFIKELASVQKKLDDFFSRDLEYNSNNTNIVKIMANDLAKVVYILQERVQFAKEAKEDLFTHKDFALGENLTSSRMARGKLIIEDSFDPKNKENAFDNIPEGFLRTKARYKELLEIKKEISSLTAKLSKELGKPIDKQDLIKINKYQIDYNRLRNEYVIKKLEILKSAIPQDLAKIYNDALNNLQERKEKNSETLKKAKKEQEKVLDEIITSNLEYLEPALQNNPYKLQEAVTTRNLDNVLVVLNRYLEENKVLLKYKTDDFDENFRGKFKKGKVETFDDFDKATQVLSRRLGKKLREKVDETLKLEEQRAKLDSSYQPKTKEEITKYILAEINQAIYYYNAKALKNQNEEALNLSIKTVEESRENLALKKERRRKTALETAFGKVSVDYPKIESENSHENYDIQPELRGKLAKTRTDLSIKQNELEHFEKQLKTAEKIGDSVYINQQQSLVDKTKEEIESLQQKAEELKQGIRESIQKVLGNWIILEDNDNLVFIAMTKETSSLANKVDSLNVALRESEANLEVAKNLYNKAIMLNNAESVLNSRETSDLEVAHTAELLLRIERKILELERMKKRAEKQRDEAKFTRTELIKFQSEIDRKLIELKRLFSAVK